MNKVMSIKKQSMLMLNDFYGKSMTNFNYLSDNMNEFIQSLNLSNDNKNKESFQKIYSMMSETKSNFQSFYSSFSEFLKVNIISYQERRSRNIQINFNYNN